MDENRILDWLKNVWGKRKGFVFKKSSLIVWDAFKAHCIEKVKNLFVRWDLW